MPELALVTIVLLRRLCVILCNAFLYPSFACTFVNILFSCAKKLTNAGFHLLRGDLFTQRNSHKIVQCLGTQGKVNKNVSSYLSHRHWKACQDVVIAFYF